MSAPPSSRPPGRRPSWADDERARTRAEESASPPLVIDAGVVLAKKYRLKEPAGFGGMAQLWVATNDATGADVCVKVLVCEGADPETVERFRREAHAAARLSHRAIVRIFDLVELGRDLDAITSGTPSALAIVMELLHGETLGDYLLKKGKLTLDHAMDLALPFVSALAHAHRAGVVHRDVKPENIFLATDPDGHVIPKVLDFGISKTHSPDALPLTIDGVMLGTPSFMSPEQARGARNVDARSDVFSAGIVLYMMLSGANPFESESFHSVVSAILRSDPPRLPEDRVPAAVWEVIEKALAKDAAARWADATELGIALRKASGRTAITDSGPHSVTSVRLAAAAAAGSGSAAVTVKAPVVDAAKQPAVPLGGTSIVTVPPVGNAELGDEPAAPRDRIVAGSPAARQRAVRIVGAVVAVAAAMVIAAVLRGPSDGSRATTTAASGTSTQSTQSTQSPPSAAVAPVQTAPATAATAEPEPPREPARDQARAVERQDMDAGAAAVAPPGEEHPRPRKRDIVAPDPGAAARRHPITGGGQPAAGDSPPSRGQEPSIVREPGF